MKLIKRSELVKSKTKFIGLDIMSDYIFQSCEEINSLKLIQPVLDIDYVLSNLFDINSDICETNDCYLQDLDLTIKLNNLKENQSLPITYEETCRDGNFNNDDDEKIYILEYEEIKKYMNLFIELYNQDIYKSERLKDELENELNNNNLTQKKRIKI